MIGEKKLLCVLLISNYITRQCFQSARLPRKCHLFIYEFIYYHRFNLLVCYSTLIERKNCGFYLHWSILTLSPYLLLLYVSQYSIECIRNKFMKYHSNHRIGMLA